MLVVAAQVPVVRGCCTEEDGRGQVVAPSFAEFIHFPWDTRLDGHTVTCQDEIRWSGSGTGWHTSRSSTKKPQKHWHHTGRRDMRKVLLCTPGCVPVLPSEQPHHQDLPRYLERDGVLEAQAQIETQPHTDLPPAALQPTSADEWAAPGNYTVTRYFAEPVEEEILRMEPASSASHHTATDGKGCSLGITKSWKYLCWKEP